MTDPAATPAQRADALGQDKATALPLDGDRHLVVEAAIAMFRSHAFHETSFEVLAAEAGLPVTRVREEFATWDEVLMATLDLWSGRRMGPVTAAREQAGTIAYLRALVRSNIDDPGLMRFLAALVNIAATPDHPLAPWLQETWRRFHTTIMTQLAKDIASGLEPATMQPARGAEQLIALYEGLQLQAMVRPGMQLLDAYDRATTRLRDGWSRTYTPPVWDLDN